MITIQNVLFENVSLVLDFDPDRRSSDVLMRSHLSLLPTRFQTVPVAILASGAVWHFKDAAREGAMNRMIGECK